MNILYDLCLRNGLLVAFLVTGCIMWISYQASSRIFKKSIPGPAIAIILGLVMAYIGGRVSGGQKGIADIPVFAGFGLLGGGMFRDFAIVATAAGARFTEIQRTGTVGIVSLFIGVILSFIIGAAIAILFGYSDAQSITTIGAGACTFIVGPVTGAAIGAASDVMALSIAAGVVKAILVTVGTPIAAKWIGLNNPQSAMIYGGLMGTTSGVAAGLAATDTALVPYGALTATFYTGLGCLLCPSLLFLCVRFFFH
jgi:malonate transporter MadM subunit